MPLQKHPACLLIILCLPITLRNLYYKDCPMQHLPEFMCFIFSETLSFWSIIWVKNVPRLGFLLQQFLVEE